MDLFSSFRDRFQHDGILYLNVKVIPKAQRTEFVELMQGPDGEEILKIKVAAVPEKGKANAELCRFLAKEFQVSKSLVSVVQGQRSPRKVIKIFSESKS